MKKNQKSFKQPKTTAPQQHIVTTKESKNFSQSKFMVALVVLILCALCFWGVRACSNFVYARSVKEFKAKATLADNLAAIICNDMVAQGVRAETDALATNPQGKTNACDNPAQAMEWKRTAFKEDGTMAALEQLKKETDDIISNLKAPSGFSTEHAALQATASALDSVIMLINNPGNDILVFFDKAQKLTSDVRNELEKTDFHFFLPLEGCKVYADKLLPLLKNKEVGQIVSDLQNVSVENKMIHGLQYRKMGFLPLPDGKGVLYKVIEEGHGPVADTDTEVKLHYEGKRMDGHVFDSSYAKGNPVTMLPKQTVKGFNKALTSMPVGSKWEVFIPADQGYGSRTAGDIPPNSDLLFTIEIIELL